MQTNIVISRSSDYVTNLLNELIDDGWGSELSIEDVDSEHIKYCAFEWRDGYIIYINEEFINDDEVRETVASYVEDSSILDSYDTWSRDYQGCRNCYID